MRRRLIRLIVTAAQGVRLAAWRLTGAPQQGAHAVALTPDDKVVLVRLTYADGWRLPGGGVGRREEPEEAALRELREEVGLTEWGAVERLEDFSGSSGVEGDRSALFLVRDVRYRARRTWEVDDVREFALDALPEEIGDWTLRAIAAGRAKGRLD